MIPLKYHTGKSAVAFGQSRFIISVVETTNAIYALGEFWYHTEIQIKIKSLIKPEH